MKNPALLDYEERKSVQCYIVARKSNAEKYFAKAKLTVILNDVNDNPPKFSQEEYHGKHCCPFFRIRTDLLLIENS